MTYYPQRHIDYHSKEEGSGPSTTMVLLALNTSHINIFPISISEKYIITIRTTIGSYGITRSITESAKINVSEFTGQLLVK
jgi:hypothetical protein